MSPFELALLCGLAAAVIVSLNNARALLWLLVGTADYLITSAYADAGLPLHPFFTALVDASVCILIYIVCRFRGGQKWELPLYSAFQLSVLFSLIRLCDLSTAYQYATSLEIANWLMLSVIFGTGIMRLADVILGDGHWRGLHRLVHLIGAPAKVNTFWFAKPILA